MTWNHWASGGACHAEVMPAQPSLTGVLAAIEPILPIREACHGLVAFTRVGDLEGGMDEDIGFHIERQTEKNLQDSRRDPLAFGPGGGARSPDSSLLSRSRSHWPDDGRLHRRSRRPDQAVAVSPFRSVARLEAEKPRGVVVEDVSLLG